MKASIVLLPGDGIGPEVVDRGPARRSSAWRSGSATRFAFARAPHRRRRHRRDRRARSPPRRSQRARRADAVLLGAVGGPKWDDPRAKVRPEQGLLGLRRALGLFANLRPVRVHPALAAASPLKEDRVDGVDVLFVRELTGGLYFGQPRLRETVGGRTRAVDTLEYTDEEIRRVVRLAFRLGRRAGASS